DQHIGARCPRVQYLGFGERRLRVVREERRDFERDPSIHTRGSLENRPEQIGRARYILQCKVEKEMLARLALTELVADRGVVRAALLDRVIEDRRIGRKTRNG